MDYPDTKKGLSCSERPKTGRISIFIAITPILIQIRDHTLLSFCSNSLTKFRKDRKELAKPLIYKEKTHFDFISILKIPFEISKGIASDDPNTRLQRKVNKLVPTNFLSKFLSILSILTPFLSISDPKSKCQNCFISKHLSSHEMHKM